MSAGEHGERRVCLLTGAGSLLGTAFCHAYAATYDIVAVYRTTRPDAVSQVDTFVDPLDPGAEIAANETPVYAVRADLEAAGQIERVVDIALARFGRVDVVVNNAAYWRFSPGGLLDVDGVLTDFDRHFSMNVKVPLQLSAQVARSYWVHQRDNRTAMRNVVNVSSLSGNRVFTGNGQGIYAASKAAQNQLTRHLAAEFATFGVRVNAVAPDSFPARVRTEDVARAIHRLDTEDVTGKVLVLEGAPAAGS